jgi:hypothetical protein
MNNHSHYYTALLELVMPKDKAKQAANIKALAASIERGKAK